MKHELRSMSHSSTRTEASNAAAPLNAACLIACGPWALHKVSRYRTTTLTAWASHPYRMLL